jgi:hypothetical protein
MASDDAVDLSLGILNHMATRQKRLEEFKGEGEPPVEQAVELLCEDHCGTYVLPFACHRVAGAWRTVGSDTQIEAQVVGWRERNGR